MPQVAWVAIAIMFLLLIASIDPHVGGWLLLVVVVGMVFKAHDKPREYI